MNLGITHLLEEPVNRQKWDLSTDIQHFFGKAMRRKPHSKIASSHRKMAAAIAMLTAMTAGAPCVVAQGLANSPNSALPDQDSLLPPEVVPLDPAAASNLSAVEAAKRQAQTSNGATTSTGASVPGLVNAPGAGGGPMMTAQQMRNAAFNSLYNQGQLQPQQMQPQFQSGFVNYNNNPMANNPALYAPYQSAMANTQPPQSQTLTGASPNNYPTQNITRGGFTNTASGIAALGTAGLLSSFLIRPSSVGSAAMGIGMFGLMMTGFGARNGFRL